LSLLTAAGLIFGSIALTLRSWKMGVMAAIPNVLPTVLLFGRMGWRRIGLSAAPTVIAGIGLGLFVVDTVYVLAEYALAGHGGRGHGRGARGVPAPERSGRHLYLAHPGPGFLEWPRGEF